MNTPLKELMDEHHVNQTALAGAIGVSRQSVEKWLDGSVALISDNPRYAPYHLPTEALASTRIIGRVVYIFNGHNA